MLRLDTTVLDTEGMLALGPALARALKSRRCNGLVVELRGDLGAGKTVFVRGLARALGVPSDVPVVSPTFTIARSYVLSGAGCEAAGLRVLHHLDAYRLTGASDLESVGFEEMWGDGRLTCVEWGEQVEEALPADRLRATLIAQPPDSVPAGDAPECPRTVSFVALGPLAGGVLKALQVELEEPFPS